MSKDDDGWRAIQNSAKRDVIFTKFAYGDTQTLQEELTAEAQKIAPNHEFFLFSDKIDATSSFEYRCAVFIDHENKQVVFANAGTRPRLNLKGFYDLVDDVNLIMHLEPNKLKSASKLNTTVLENLGDDAKDYQFHYTGHSLGAAMADIQAVDMHLQMNAKGIHAEKGISTVTFDNPGVKPIVDKMFKHAGIDPKFNPVDHNTFNNRKNFINTLNPQVGKTFEIEPEGQEKLSFLELTVALIAKVVSANIKGVAPEFVIKICEWVACGSISKQLDTHKLENFEKVFVEEKGKIKPISKSEQVETKYNKNVFNDLVELKKINKDIGKAEFTMKSPEGEEITFSKLELSKVSNASKSSPLDIANNNAKGISIS
jgi:hypothetical protein